MTQNCLNYELITQNAFQVASHFLSDADSAQEIAQLTAIECFLNEENMRIDTLHNWIYTVAKNKSLNLIKVQNKKLDIDPNLLATTIQAEETVDEIEFSEILSEIPKSIINLKDRKILQHALDRGLKKAARDLNKNEDSFRIKIYRLKQELILYQKLSSGMKTLDPIPGTRLHNNLLNFLRKLKTCLENNDFCFFVDFELDDESRRRLEATSINRIVKYQLDIIKQNFYEVIVFYFDHKEMLDSIRFQISVDPHSRLKFITLPQMPKKIIKINNKNIPADLKAKLKPNKAGLLPLSREELDKEIEEKVKEVEVVYDLEE
jgi:DNA-directed RNA polymerase specialized sigma24 family protein